MIEVIRTCIPIIVGALIAIIPNAINISIDRRTQRKISVLKQKEEMYAKLIDLLEKTLTNPSTVFYCNELRHTINIINISGSREVVKTLAAYTDTWSSGTSEVQNKRYSDLILAIRKDLCIDKRTKKKFPNVGLVTINLNED